MITPKQAYQRLGFILLIFSLLSLAHSIWLPLSQAPDELDHFLYSRFIAHHSRLPLNAEEREVAGRKSYLPPLYHGLVTALIGWSNNDNPPYLKLIRNSPRFDLARALFYTEHLVNTEDEGLPYRGVVLMWHLGRVVSVITSLGVIVVAFFTTLEIFPKNYRLATMAASIIAFVPTFIFISSAMSYEPLLALLIGLYFLFLIKIVKGNPRLRNYIWLGLLAGLAVTTKYASLILPAQIIGVVTYLAWRHGWGWSGWLKRVTLAGLAAILASSWWFLFLMINFNQVDELGPVVGLLKPIIAGGTDTTQNYVAATLTGGKIGQTGEIERPPFWAWVWQIFQSFWFEKVGDYPVDLVAPLLIGLVCLLAVIGLARKWQRWPGERILITLFVSHIVLFVVFPLLRFLIQGELSHTAQGRHILFPIATVLPLLMVYSWQSWLPRSTQRYLALALTGGLVGWTMAQLIHIVAYYPPPLPVRTIPDVIAQIPQRLNKTFGDQIILLGYESQVIPAASTLKLSLYWQSPTYADEDYQMEVSLVQNSVTGLKWSAYPINGRYPTRIWESWEMIRDDWELPLSDLPPGDYQLQVQLRGADGPLKVEDTDTLILTNITLPETLPIEPDIPLPVVVAGREVIRGVSLWPAATYPRLNLPEYRPRMAISFVWQGQPDKNETVKWLLVDSQGKVFPSQSASPHFEYLIVRPDWQPGLYRLRAEVWQGESVVASQETAPVLTVFNKQPRLLEPPPISYPLEANFANRIKLLGYDLPERSLAPGQGVPITLYWQGLRTVGQDYTFFTKLLDEQHQLWGSLDRFAKDGYKTTHWLENEVVVDKFELPIAANTPPGVYWLNVGLYFGMGQSPVSLPVVLEQQLTDLTSVTFGPIKVGGAPPGVVARDVAPEHRLEIDLADVIRLRGYDMSQINKTLSVKLYWESLASTETDYTVFLHVRNQAGQTVTQMDRLPASGSYPTSLWSPGEVIPDELSVSLPEHLPPGQYSIVTDLYKFATETRLPVAGSTDNSITLSVVEIQ